VAQWISFYLISRTREPEPEHWKEPESKQRMLDFPMFRQILKRDKNFVRYMVARSISFLGGTATTFLAVYGIRRFALGDSQAAIFSGIIFFTGIIGYAYLGGLTDKIGPKRIVVFSLFCLAASLALTVIARNIWVFYIVFILQGIYGAALNMGDMMLVMELGEESLRPIYLGLARTMTGVVLIVVSVSGGLIVEKLGFEFMFWLATGMTLVSVVLFSTVKDHPRNYSKRLRPVPAEDTGSDN
jgi:MFS family permease